MGIKDKQPHNTNKQSIQRVEFAIYLFTPLRAHAVIFLLRSIHGMENIMRHLRIISYLTTLFLAITIGGCSSEPTGNQEAPQKTEAVSKATEGAPPATEQAAVTPTPSPENPTVDVEKPEKTIPPQTVTAERPAEKHHEETTGVAPEQAQKWLVNGNVRFTKNRLRKDGQSKKDIQRLSNGQKPHSIILSCSDSRVPPEIVFDQKLGEIFVVRTAGESLEANAVGSIEYAIEHLGARNLVVMGHTQCGAVKAALGTLNGGDAGSPNLNKLVADLHPHLRNFSSTAPSKNLEAESWANVSGVATDLITRSNIIAEALRSGKVKMREGLYHLDSGKVDFHQ